MAPRTEPENWSRWPAPQGWPLPVQQPTFVMEQSYNTHMIPMPPPQYPVPPHGFVYGTYDTPETPSHPVAPSTKQYLAERPIIGTHGQTQHSLPEPLQENGHLPTKQATLSPVIKSEPQPHEIPRGGETPPNPVDGQVSVKFTTGIDRLLKIIQQRNDESGEKTSAAQTKSKARTNSNTVTGLASRKRSKAATSNADPSEKPYACPKKKCNQRFSQITQLHIHERSHTGESPHKCTYAGCGKRFTQKGNLRTHERRHRGERPFKCHFAGCTRAFPQKGNLAAHLDTHYKRNVFHCIFKSCGKSFSSRGNLKTHQNNYHEEELRALELKFSGVRSVTEMTKADQELWDYFLTVHKNSNKGIKGRGKECRVELLPNSNSTPHQYQLQSPVELQHAPYPVSHGLASSMNFGHFGMPRNNLGQDFLVSRGGHGHGYVYEIDQSSISSGTLTPASSPGGLYDDHHHHRGVPFHDRVYETGYARS